MRNIQEKGRRRQANFKEAECYPSAVVLGLHGEKMVCVRGVPGVTGTLGEANSHFDPTQTGRGPHHHVEAAVDSCSSILLALRVHVHTIYTRTCTCTRYIRQKFRTSLSKKIGVNTCFEDGQKIMMIRVKVNSKSELVEDREGKSTLYGVICCCDDRLLSRAVICGHTI